MVERLYCEDFLILHNPWQCAEWGRTFYKRSCAA